MKLIPHVPQVLSRLVAISLLLMSLSGCNGDSPVEPPMPVSIYMPNVAGYQTSPVEGSVGNALDTLGIDPGTVGGLIIDFLDEVAACLMDRGVLDIRLYVNTSNPTDVGMVGLLRRTGLAGNALSCVAQVVVDGRVVDPCADSGSFQVDGDEILFGYSGLDPDFCSAVAAHFAQY